MKEKVIIVGGATASGKSDFAVTLAKSINSEIISCDSMQIFKGMDIGTAKITYNEMNNVKHHMLDIVEPTENFSVSQYVTRARKIISSLNASGKVPVIVGGTGLYIDALIYDFGFSNAGSDDRYREELFELAQAKGNSYLHDMLKEIDPPEAEKIHENNVKRVIRALEIYKLTGKTKEKNDKRLIYETLIYVLQDIRQDLYQRINSRVDIMLKRGFADEIKELLDRGVTFDMQSMQGIGYKEWNGFFDGTKSLYEVSDEIKKASRHYAKRQLTWFNNKYKDIAEFVTRQDIDRCVDEAIAFSKEGIDAVN